MTESVNYSNIIVFKPLALVGTTPTYEVRNITRATSRFVIVGVGLFRSGFYFAKETKWQRKDTFG